MHADIQTPPCCPFVPSAVPPPHEADISSDDTSDDFYQRAHQAPLEEERARWAPLSANGPANKTTKTRGRPAPLFPTPAEGVAILRRALRNVKRPRKPSRQHHIRPARRAALANFDRSLAAFADLEASLERQRFALQAHLPLLQAEQDPYGSATFRLPLPPLHDSTSRRVSPDPTVPNGIQSEDDVPAHSAVCSIAEGALADLDDLELVMREKSKALADRVAAMAEQAHIPMRTPITCRSLRNDIARAKRADDEKLRAGLLSDEDRRPYSLSECMRREIDPKLYPVLAKTFRLHPDYRLDGTRRPLEELLQDDNDEGMQEVSPVMTPPRAVNSMDTPNGYALDVDALPHLSQDKDPDFIDPEPTMRDSSDAMEVLPDSNPIVVRASVAKTPKPTTKSNGGTPRGSLPRRPGRPRKKRPTSARTPQREKKEKKSFRIAEKNAEFISSDPSDLSDTPTPSFVGARYAISPAMPAPMRFHHVVDCDKEGSDSLDIPMPVVELDDDDAVL